MKKVKRVSTKKLCSKMAGSCVLAVLVWGGIIQSVTWAQSSFEDLLRRIPNSANALMLVDVKGVHSSPLAVKEGWKSEHEAKYVKSPLLLPPDSDKMVLASQMNPNRDFEEVWTGAVIQLTSPISMQSIAKAEGGVLDEIAGVPAVLTPTDAYIVKFDSQLLGVMYPAHRQAVARWVRYGKTNQSVNLSPYLKKAADKVDGKTTQIILALDLADVVQPYRLHENLKNSELTKGDPNKQRQWEKLILGIQGVTLAVQIGEKARGVLTVDFSDSTKPFGSQAKTLVMSVLDRYGVGLDQMEKWNVKLDGNSIVLQGDLTKPAMRKIFSLLELPADISTAKTGKTSGTSSTKPKSSSTSGRPTPPQTSEDKQQQVVKASLAYFKSVSTLLEDLRKEFKSNRDARRSLAAVFLERYARRIDRLPTLNVDPELLAYGTKVARTLRSTSVASKQAGIRTGVRKSGVYGSRVYTGGGYAYGPYGYGYDYGPHSSRSTQSIKTEIKRQEQAKARQTRFANWKQIEDATAAIRLKMTKKYGVQF